MYVYIFIYNRLEYEQTCETSDLLMIRLTPSHSARVSRRLETSNLTHGQYEEKGEREDVKECYRRIIEHDNQPSKKYNKTLFCNTTKRISPDAL